MGPEQLRREVRASAEKHSDRLVAVLRQIVLYRFPEAVEEVAFEVFSQQLASEFPIRAFFLDRRNTEYFVYSDGEAQYPSPVEPDLIKTGPLLDDSTLDAFDAANPDLDCWSIAVDAVIDWFSDCWTRAGGSDFSRRASIRLYGEPSSRKLAPGVTPH